MTRSRHDWLVWLVAALVAMSVGLAVSALPRKLADRRDRVATVGPDSGPAVAPLAIEGILALAPFGRPAVPTTPGIVPETDLSLTLHGVVRAIPPSRSRAIVSSDGGPAKSHLIGDEIADGMRLVEVQSDHVVIENDGRRETLSFPHRKLALPAVAATSPDAGVIGDFDALRQLIFNQANDPDQTSEQPPPSDDASPAVQDD